MKRKLLTAVAIAGCLCSATLADIAVTIDGGAMTNGFMNVSELPINGGGFVFGSGWTPADLSATFNGPAQVTMIPNSIGDPDPFWYIGGGAPGNPGNKIMEAALYAQESGTYAGQTVTFAGDVSAFSLTGAHVATAFIRDFAPDYSSFNEATYDVTATGAFSIDLATVNDAGRHVQYGLRMTGENVWVTDLDPFGAVTVDAIPEPATLGLLGIFGGAMLFMRRRFKR